MPPPIQNVMNNDIVEVRIVQDYLGQTLMNVLHYRVETMPAPVEAGLFFQQLDSLLKQPGSILKQQNAMQDEECLHVLTDYQVVAPTRGPSYSFPGLNAGGIERPAGASATPNVGFAVTKRSSKIGRGRNGTHHLGGINSSQMANGYATAPMVTALQLLAGALKAVPGVEGPGELYPILWNPDGPAGEINYVIGADPHSTVRVSRRRTVGVGI